MVQKFAGSKRLTHRYNEGWSHLDEYEYLGDFKLLNSRHIPPSEKEADYGSDGTYFITVAVPRGISRADLNNVLVNQFNGGCRCEHDCCGHVQHRAETPIHQKRRNWVVPVRAYRNI